MQLIQFSSFMDVGAMPVMEPAPVTFGYCKGNITGNHKIIEENSVRTELYNLRKKKIFRVCVFGLTSRFWISDLKTVSVNLTKLIWAGIFFLRKKSSMTLSFADQKKIRMISFKDITKALTWISGSMAGITATIYVIGYIATISHLHLLGILNIVQYDQIDYFLKGANFFIIILLFLTIPAIAFAVLYYCISVLILGTKKLKTSYVFYIKSLIVFISSCFMIILFNPIKTGNDLLLLTSISDLIFAKSDKKEQNNDIYITTSSIGGLSFLKESNQSNIEKLIISRDSGKVYFIILMKITVFAFLFFLVRRVSLSWSYYLIIISPFIAVFALHLIFLPIFYGILLMNLNASTISIIADEKIIQSKNNEMLLIHKNEKEFIVWDDTIKKILFLPKDSVQAAVIGKTMPLFKAKNR